MISPTELPTVYVVIAVRNRLPHTDKCLESLHSQTYSAMHIVVIDDGSSDGTAEHVRHRFPEVTLINADGNLWWTGATALGVEWVLARCSADDFILTLNNDTTVRSDYVETLVGSSLGTRSKVVLGSVAVDDRDGDTISDGGPKLNWFTAAWHSENAGQSLRRLLKNGVFETYPDVLPGRGTLIPVACLRLVGNFDRKRFPHYAADYEFSRRALRAGYRLKMSYLAPVFSAVRATGTTTVHGRIPWRRFLGMFVSRRSPACLVYRWRFAVRSAPYAAVPFFLVSDTVRVIAGGLRNQLRSESDGGTED